MGQSKKRRAAFFAAHPVCCFCGGSEKAVEEDHIPSRATFLRKDWPEGFSFPACYACNHGSAQDELVLALLSRMYPDDSSREAVEEIGKLMGGVHRYLPAVFEEWRPSARTDRRAARHLNWQPGPGESYGDLNVMPIGPLTTAAVERFCFKLTKALFYKESGQIVPSAANIKVAWFTNFQWMVGLVKLEKDLLDMFVEGRAPVLRRNGADLHSQFTYRVVEAADSGAMAFQVLFREAIGMIALVVPGENLAAGSSKAV